MGLTGPKYRDFINTCGDIMIVMGIYKQLNVTLKGLSEKEGVYPIYIYISANGQGKLINH